MKNDRIIKIEQFNVTIEHEIEGKKVIVEWERGDCYFEECGESYFEAYGIDVLGKEYEASWLEDTRSGGVFEGIEDVENRSVI